MKKISAVVLFVFLTFHGRALSMSIWARSQRSEDKVHAQLAILEPFWFSSVSWYGSVLDMRNLIVLHTQSARPRAIQMDDVFEHLADGMMDKSAEDVAKSAGDAVAEKLEKHGDAFAGFMSGVQSSVFNSISSQSVGPQGFVENFQGRWEEDGCTFVPFLLGVDLVWN